MSRINWPHQLLEDAWNDGVYQSGATEPWVQQLIASLLIASDQRNVLELGGYLGLTSVWLADALQRMGGGTLTTVEIEPKRCEVIYATLGKLDIPDIDVSVACGSSLEYIQELEDDSIGFAFVDDCHEEDHVAKELEMLLPKIKKDGIICMHDVCGLIPGNDYWLGDHIPVTEDSVCLDLPRLGPYAGGLGIIQL